MKSQVSVVIPNRNHGRFMPGAVDALLQQSWPPDEVIVIDDASTDDSVEIIESIARRAPSLHVFRNRQSRGPAHAVNVGLAAASGKYIYFAAADDLVLPGFFESAVRALEEYGEAALCCSDEILGFPALKRARTYKVLRHCGATRFIRPSEYVDLQRRGPVRCPTAASLFRRRDFDKVGLREDLRWHCDYFLYFALTFRYGAVYCPGRLFSLFMVDETSYGSSRRTSEEAVVVREILDLLLSDFQDVKHHFIASGVLSHFAELVVDAAAADSKYGEFVTPVMRVRAARRRLRRTIGRVLSPQVKNRLRRICGRTSADLRKMGATGAAVAQVLSSRAIRMS